MSSYFLTPSDGVPWNHVLQLSPWAMPLSVSPRETSRVLSAFTLTASPQENPLPSGAARDTWHSGEPGESIGGVTSLNQQGGATSSKLTAFSLEVARPSSAIVGKQLPGPAEDPPSPESTLSRAEECPVESSMPSDDSDGLQAPQESPKNLAGSSSDEGPALASLQKTLLEAERSKSLTEAGGSQPESSDAPVRSSFDCNASKGRRAEGLRVSLPSAKSLTSDSAAASLTSASLRSEERGRHEETEGGLFLAEGPAPPGGAASELKTKLRVGVPEFVPTSNGGRTSMKKPTLKAEVPAFVPASMLLPTASSGSSLKVQVPEFVPQATRGAPGSPLAASAMSLSADVSVMAAGLAKGLKLKAEAPEFVPGSLVLASSVGAKTGGSTKGTLGILKAEAPEFVPTMVVGVGMTGQAEALQADQWTAPVDASVGPSSPLGLAGMDSALSPWAPEFPQHTASGHLSLGSSAVAPGQAVLSAKQEPSVLVLGSLGGARGLGSRLSPSAPAFMPVAAPSTAGGGTAVGVNVTGPGAGTVTVTVTVAPAPVAAPPPAATAAAAPRRSPPRLRSVLPALTGNQGAPGAVVKQKALSGVQGRKSENASHSPPAKGLGADGPGLSQAELQLLVRLLDELGDPAQRSGANGEGEVGPTGINGRARVEEGLPAGRLDENGHAAAGASSNGGLEKRQRLRLALVQHLARQALLKAGSGESGKGALAGQEDGVHMADSGGTVEDALADVAMVRRLAQQAVLVASGDWAGSGGESHAGQKWALRPCLAPANALSHDASGERSFQSMHSKEREASSSLADVVLPELPETLTSPSDFASIGDISDADHAWGVYAEEQSTAGGLAGYSAGGPGVTSGHRAGRREAVESMSDVRRKLPFPDVVPGEAGLLMAAGGSDVSQGLQAMSQRRAAAAEEERKRLALSAAAKEFVPSSTMGFPGLASTSASALPLSSSLAGSAASSSSSSPSHSGYFPLPATSSFPAMSSGHVSRGSPAWLPSTSASLADGGQGGVLGSADPWSSAGNGASASAGAASNHSSSSFSSLGAAGAAFGGLAVPSYFLGTVLQTHSGADVDSPKSTSELPDIDLLLPPDLL